MSGAVLDSWYAAIRSGDAPQLRNVVTPDVYIFWNGDAATIPWAGRYAGIDGVLSFFQELGKHIEVVAIQETGRSVTEDHAVITIAGQWRVKASGALVTASACNLFRIRDGRIAGYEVYNDTARFGAALVAGRS